MPLTDMRLASFSLVRAVAMLVLVAAAGCATPPPGASVDTSRATTVAEPVVALASAYEPEVEALLEHLRASPDGGIDGTRRIKGITFYEGHWRGQPIVAFATGMSIANAAMSTQILADHFHVRALLFAGIAGAIDDGLKPADVDVPERWYYHDESAYFNAGADGEYIVGKYYEQSHYFPQYRHQDANEPDYDHFGMIFPDEVSVSAGDWPEPRQIAYFSVDPALLDAAYRAVEALPPIPVEGGRNATLRVGGNGVSGSVFVDNAEYRDWIRRVFRADIAEMEGAAIGQAALVNDLPWIVVRGVSDLAGGQHGQNTEEIYDRIASRNAVTVLFATLDTWLGQGAPVTDLSQVTEPAVAGG